jgi:hypothetical protein
MSNFLILLLILVIVIGFIFWHRGRAPSIEYLGMGEGDNIVEMSEGDYDY